MTAAPITFAEIADELRLAANREAIGAEQLELWLGRRELIVKPEHLAQVQRSAEIIGEAHRLFALIVARGREAEIRHMIEPSQKLPIAAPPAKRGWLAKGRARVSEAVRKRLGL